MSRRPLSGRLRPTRQQELLLRCAFGTPETAVQSWTEASATLDFERLDWGSHALLPLVYRSLEAAGSDDPLLGRLQGIYKKAWFVNHLLLNRAQVPLGALRAAGAEPLLLHGAALLAAYYPDPALRRVPCLDVAVRATAQDEARRALGRARWARHPDSPSLESGRALTFVDSGGRLLFLHRRLPDGLDVPGSDRAGAEDVWTRARELTLGDVAAMRLDPTDELICACAAGPDIDLVTGVQWLADAAIVVQSARDELDWSRLAESARHRRVTARVRGALEYLDRKVGIPVPAAVLEELAAVPVPHRERSAHWLYSRPVGRLGGLPGTLGRHMHETADLRLAASVGRLPRFLSDTWELDSPRRIPGAVARKARG